MIRPPVRRCSAAAAADDDGVLRLFVAIRLERFPGPSH